MRAAAHARRHVAAALLLAALTGAFWVHAIYVRQPTESGLLNSDLAKYFHPATVYLHDELRAGRLPTWNPHQMAGYPFLAAQITAVLYPPNLLAAALLPPARAHEAQVLFHLFAAGFLTWLFARRIGLGFWPSVASGAAFMLSSELSHRVYNPAYLATIAWLPALFWAAHGLLSEGGLRWAVALGAVAALCFLGGNTQGAVYEWQAVGVFWAVGLWVRTPAGRRLQTVAWTALAAVLAVALIAPQLLPTLELAREGVRGLPGLSVEEASSGSVGRWRLLDVAMGAPNAAFVLALLLAPFAIADRERRWLWLFFAATAVWVALFMMGTATPVWRIHYALPFGNLFRTPARAAAIPTFCVSVLVGLGIHGLARAAERFRPRVPALARWVGAGLALIVAADAYARAELGQSVPVLWSEEAGGPSQFVASRRGLQRVFVEDLGAFTDRAVLAKLGTIHRSFVVPDYEPLMPRAYAELFDKDRLWHGRLTFHRRDRRAPRLSVRPLDLMGVRDYVLPGRAYRQILAEMTALLEAAPRRRGDVWVGTRTKALPRAYVVGRTRVVADPERARRTLLDPRFAPRHEAVVSEGPTLNASPGSVRRASVRSYGPDEVVIDATCAEPCVLVLSDLHYPGWEVTVDGEPAPIVATNIAFRGVFLRPGDHRVVHRFRPRSLWLGLGIAAAGVLAVAALSAARARRPGSVAACATGRSRTGPD